MINAVPNVFDVLLVHPKESFQGECALASDQWLTAAKTSDFAVYRPLDDLGFHNFVESATARGDRNDVGSNLSEHRRDF